MISRIKLKNFKCFEKLDLELTALNVLSGINSMGKSTVIQALLLLRQTFDIDSLDKGLHLNGELINIGTGYDVLYRNSNEDSFTISIDYKSIDAHFSDSTTKELHFDMNYKYKNNSDFQELVSKPLSFAQRAGLNVFADSFSYISANRLGPQRIYEKSYHKVVDNKQIGINGEWFVDFIAEHGSNIKITNKKLLHPNVESQTLIYQLQAWLSEISPGININTKSYNEAGLVGLSFSKEGYTPINVGFGLSYVAPVILAILKANPGDLLIIENPEAHLHPRGQRKMGELISAACSSGIQIILETHSDHILNGIRLSVKNKVINRNDIRLNYFYIEKTADGSITHKKSSPAILDDGSLSAWPDGFMDEWDKAIDELF